MRSCTQPHREVNGGCGGAVSGQQHPLTNLAPPLEGVETTYWLPEYPEYQFPAGALVHTPAKSCKHGL